MLIRYNDDEMENIIHVENAETLIIMAAFAQKLKC